MKIVSATDFRKYIPWAQMNTSNRVYPLSIAEGIQSGDIYVNDGPKTSSVFFWHYCGFGYISGRASEAFLNDIYTVMMSDSKSRRLVLIVNEDPVIRFFQEKNVRMESRIEYFFLPKKQNAASFNTERFRIEPIDGSNISRIEGRIIPAFSWNSNRRFLENGFGYVAIANECVCAVAFSSAVSSEEIDIGVETREEYRKNGLAQTLTEKMCEKITEMGKRPVWAHSASNTGSRSTALGCGFVEDMRNTLIKPN